MILLASHLECGLATLDSRTSEQVPLVRIAAQLGLDNWAAEIRRADWECSEAKPPKSPLEWEALLREALRILTGYRGIIDGGGAECRRGSVGGPMTKTASARLKALRAEVKHLRERGDAT